ILARRLPADRPRREAGQRVSATDSLTTSGLRFLDEIAGLPDRRAALQRLTEHALELASRLNGLRLRPSQTARDVLTLLLPGWRHRAALNLIVRTEEAVHFGGAPLADGVFADCLA